MRDILARISSEFSQLQSSQITPDDINRLNNLYNAFQKLSSSYISKLKEIKNKKDQIKAIKNRIDILETINNDYSSFLVDTSNNIEATVDPLNHISNVLSPYVNDKNIPSKTVIEYAKKISNFLQAEPNYNTGVTPMHFQPPKVDFEPIRWSYLYYTSRADGKVITLVFMLLFIFY